MRWGFAAVLASLVACAAPDRLSFHRSPLLSVPIDPLSPEGRASPIPAFATQEHAAVESDVDADGESMAATAREYVGRKAVVAGGRRYPDECTGLVRAVYALHGWDLLAEAEQGDSGVDAIWRFAQRHGRLHRDAPKPGDLVFFAGTYDRNRDGRANDGLTHVGIVDRIESDGTVLVIHRVASRVVTYRMNLSRPSEHADAHGRVVNDWLRGGKRSKLAGELFAGYGTLAKH